MIQKMPPSPGDATLRWVYFRTCGGGAPAPLNCSSSMVLNAHYHQLYISLNHLSGNSFEIPDGGGGFLFTTMEWPWVPDLNLSRIYYPALAHARSRRESHSLSISNSPHFCSFRHASIFLPHTTVFHSFPAPSFLPSFLTPPTPTSTTGRRTAHG